VPVCHVKMLSIFSNVPRKHISPCTRAHTPHPFPLLDLILPWRTAPRSLAVFLICKSPYIAPRYLCSSGRSKRPCTCVCVWYSVLRPQLPCRSLGQGGNAYRDDLVRVWDERGSHGVFRVLTLLRRLWPCSGLHVVGARSCRIVSRLRYTPLSMLYL
jgi:hypothetical protein